MRKPHQIDEMGPKKKKKAKKSRRQKEDMRQQEETASDEIGKAKTSQTRQSNTRLTYDDSGVFLVPDACLIPTAEHHFYW